MKLLRNPVVVGILAIIAVVVVAYQISGDRLSRAGRRSAPTPATATSTSVAEKPGARPAVTTAAPKPAPKPPPVRAVTYTNLDAALLPTQGVDVAVIEGQFNSWVSAPLRDPFLLLPLLVRENGLLDHATNSPVASWVLQAIWNQTDSRRAVINNRVWQVGDEIEQGYKLIRIENDEVWFQGPYRNERLGFSEPKRAAPAAPPPVTQPPAAGTRT